MTEAASGCRSWRQCGKRCLIVTFALVAIAGFIADWELTTMSRIWEVHVAKLSALVLNSTSEGQGSSSICAGGGEGTIYRLGLVIKLCRKGQECRGDALAWAQDAAECGVMAAAAKSCGRFFMFSDTQPDPNCFCCTASAASEDGPPPANPAWNVYLYAGRLRQEPANDAAEGSGEAATPAVAPIATNTELPVPVPVPAPPSPTSTTLPVGVAAGTSEKTFVPGQKYEPVKHLKHLECAEQAYNFGHIATAQECDKLTAKTEECGQYFMFSMEKPEWACRCCAPFGEGDGPSSPFWDVYKRLYPRAESIAALPTSPPLIDPFHGLPVAEGTRPDWLVRDDALIVDARSEQKGGILILQAVLMDVNSLWGSKRHAGEVRPEWLRAILATNRAHAQKHGHAMVLRAQPTQPQLTKWMIIQCGDKSTSLCTRQNERENFNWEKHLMISDYLRSPQEFSHVLMLDADAALVQPQLDTLRRIAAIMEEEKKDLFLTDEDWLDQNGKGRINGGLMFAKNTNFTKNLFLDTFDAHLKGPAHYRNWRIGVPVQQCSSNEQICLNDLYYGANSKFFRPFAMMASGKQYNRGAERGGEAHLTDPTTEIMHWMGGSKNSAGTALCSGKRDLTFGGPSGYGCKK